MGVAFALALAAVPCATWAADADAGRVVYPLQRTNLEAPSFCYLQIPTPASKPAGAGATPAFADPGGVCYMELRLGDGPPLLVAVEQVRRDGKTTYRVYVDVNGDRALADETPQQTEEDLTLRRGSLQYTPVVTVPVTYRLPSGETRVDCRFRLGFYPPPAGQTLPGGRTFYGTQLVFEQGWSGPVTFGGQTVTLTVVDGDGDAKIQLRDTLSRDSLRIDGLAGAAQPLRQSLTRCLEVDGVLYSLEVRPDGGEVAVSRYTSPLGTIAWSAQDGFGQPTELSSLSLRGANQNVTHHGTVPVSRALPPGTYYVSYTIGSGRPSVSFQAAKPIEVRADTTIRIGCGGPVTVTGSVSQSGSGEETTLQVGVKAANAAGSPFQVSGQRSAGTVEVLGPDGVSRGTGNMEYG